ncbi:MAG: hypothetical protein AB7F19_06215 [Candidatus Babeliales bacterium]
MNSKYVLLITLITFGTQCIAMVKIKMPTAAVLQDRLKSQPIFVKTTKIIEQLAEKELPALEIAKIVDKSIETYNKNYIGARQSSNVVTPSDAAHMQTMYFLNARRGTVLMALFKDHPEQLQAIAKRIGLRAKL